MKERLECECGNLAPLIMVGPVDVRGYCVTCFNFAHLNHALLVVCADGDRYILGQQLTARCPELAAEWWRRILPIDAFTSAMELWNRR